MYNLALSPVLGGFVTPAGCTRLNLELSIFYALATASIFSILSNIFFSLSMFSFTHCNDGVVY